MLSVEGLIAIRSATFNLRIPVLRVAAKKILCLAGPNGSGKTTFIECLAGLLAPAAGTISIGGRTFQGSLRDSRALIGYIPDEEDWFVKALTAREYFLLLESIYRQAGITGNMAEYQRRLAQTLRFTAFDQPLTSLSHGNKKKVQIIAGLMHQPKVLIIDELRNGLDPLAIIAAEQIVRSAAARGACVVAATHDLWWAERIADEVLVLDNGTVALHQPTAGIIREHGHLEDLFVHLMQEQAHAGAV